MARGIARIGREKTLATLARKLFHLDEAGPEEQQRAERALLEANPQLARREAYVAGQMIMVPHVAGLRRTDRVDLAGADPEAATTEALARLEAGARQLKEGIGQARKRLDEGEARLRDRAFLRLAQASLPNSAEAVFEETQSGIKAGRELLDEREAELTEAFAAASRSATELARILRKRGPDDG
ncbi:MAG: hypothetical protein KDK29_12265 [Sedimentitalea sp.]|nr:hypothetical protein [Sedimentitalea sp.]